jgi:hypothetical protein
MSKMSAVFSAVAESAILQNLDTFRNERGPLWPLTVRSQATLLVDFVTPH